MNHIRICNLRSLANTGSIELKPITLMVGANGSGKSSFLRIFPLLRQSAEVRTLSGLLLNEGEVNFGFFHEAIRRDADPAELKLEFGMTLEPLQSYNGYYLGSLLIEPLDAKCELTYIKRSADQHYPYLCSVRISLGNPASPDVIEIRADETGKVGAFKVNSWSATNDISNLRLRATKGLVPSLQRILGDDSLSSEEEVESELFEQQLLSATTSLFHGKTGTATKVATFASIRIGVAEKMLQEMKGISALSWWPQQVGDWDLGTTAFVTLRNLLLARATRELLSAINLYVSQLARSVHYFAPVRARVQRDYLKRDVQVESVDAEGANVAMVLGSLGANALGKFREWMGSHFGFEVYPKTVADGARVALRMKEVASGAEFNLADMGFGFSQMLPFLVQIWKLLEHEPTRQRLRFGGRSPSALSIPRGVLIAIEQPELHLHPALQARLADLFVAMARLGLDLKIPVRFMLETHSPALIERVGQLVESGSIESRHIQVLLFERDGGAPNTTTAKVRAVQFDGEGVLQEWPFGFLAPTVNPPLTFKAVSEQKRDVE